MRDERPTNARVAGHCSGRSRVTAACSARTARCHARGPKRRAVAARAATPSRSGLGAVTRRGLLLLLGTGAMLAWSAGRALSDPPLDANGAPILLPGQTPTPQTNAREREAVQQSRDRAIQNRAQQRTLEGQQQFQNN